MCCVSTCYTSEECKGDMPRVEELCSSMVASIKEEASLIDSKGN